MLCIPQDIKITSWGHKGNKRERESQLIQKNFFVYSRMESAHSCQSAHISHVCLEWFDQDLKTLNAKHFKNIILTCKPPAFGTNFHLILEHI